jgi:hypothetical protein
VQLCPIYHGDPGYVLERAQADDALQLADELMIWLPPNFTLAENKELLDNIVEFIAPALGWRPAESADRVCLSTLQAEVASKAENLICLFRLGVGLGIVNALKQLEEHR